MNRNSIVKHIAVAAGFLALTFTPTMSRAQNSQQPPEQDKTQTAPATPTPQAGRKHGALAGLNLTADQRTEFKKIHEATKAEVEAVGKDETLTADQKAAKIHQLRHGARLQMVKLLTPEQRQQMRANIREMRASRKEQQQQQTPPAQPQG